MTIPPVAVEEYLKAIVLAQSLPGADQQFVPMGEIASAVGVSPGAATKTAKALAESSLLEYEPYRGVRLLPSGLRVAYAVLRRHRLFELYLVQALGMPWDEAHRDAERLEHAVSDRIIERIDDILGQPKVNQYGEPIPSRSGELVASDLHTLLTCALGKPVTIRRVTDHQAAFLRFIEDHHLMPGQLIEVEDRNDISDSVRLKGRHDQRITIGMRAAAKLLVE